MMSHRSVLLLLCLVAAIAVGGGVLIGHLSSRSSKAAHRMVTTTTATSARVATRGQSAHTPSTGNTSRVTSTSSTVVPQTAPGSPTTLIQAASWESLCSQAETEAGNGFVTTDHIGNKASISVCGYTVTGTDAAGDVAPAGEYFINIVYAATDQQPDRPTDLSGFDSSVYLAPKGMNCGIVPPTTVPGVLYGPGSPEYASSGNNAFSPCTGPGTGALTFLTRSGGIVPASDPQVAPGPFVMLFDSTLVPDSLANSSNLTLHFLNPISSTGASSESFQSNMGAGNRSDLSLF